MAVVDSADRARAIAEMAKILHDGGAPQVQAEKAATLLVDAAIRDRGDTVPEDVQPGRVNQ